MSVKEHCQMTVHNIGVPHNVHLLIICRFAWAWDLLLHWQLVSGGAALTQARSEKHPCWALQLQDSWVHRDYRYLIGNFVHDVYQTFTKKKKRKQENARAWGSSSGELGAKNLKLEGPTSIFGNNPPNWDGEDQRISNWNVGRLDVWKKGRRRVVV